MTQTATQEIKSDQEFMVDLRQGAGQFLVMPKVLNRIGTALGGWMNAEEFANQILIAFQKPVMDYSGQFPQEIGPISEICEKESQLRAALTCAALQLVPTLSHVALIPRKSKGKYLVDVMVQWQGLQALILRTPGVKDISARLVFDGDEFEFDGTANLVTNHQYDPFDEERVLKKDLSNLRGGYLVVLLSDGRVKHHMVSLNYILKCRNCAKTKKTWDEWPEPQTLKTIYRSGYARRIVQIDPLVEKKVTQAIEYDDEYLGNDPSRPALLNAPLKSEARIANLTVDHVEPANDPKIPESYPGSDIGAPEEPSTDEQEVAAGEVVDNISVMPDDEFQKLLASLADTAAGAKTPRGLYSAIDNVVLSVTEGKWSHSDDQIKEIDALVANREKEMRDSLG